jgi:prepilin-type N-terminal cleavage/methylation domain-containing protein
MVGRAKQRGFTLIELMMTVAIIGVVLAIGTFNFTRMAPSFRLRGTTEQLAARLQLLKMRAVATNKRAWFVPLVTQNAYTGFIDTSSYGTVQGSEFPRTEFDMANVISISSGSIPGVGTTCPGFVLPVGITFGVPTPAPGVGPEGLPISASSQVCVNGSNGGGSVRFIGFKESGLALVNFAGGNAFPSASSAIFLRNQKNEGYAVVVSPTGRVRFYKWTGNSWN